MSDHDAFLRARLAAMTPDERAAYEANRDQILAGIAATVAIPKRMPIDPAARVVRVGDVQHERVRWLWRNRIPFGKLFTLDGMPGLGKSTVTLDLAARVSTGQPMPGETTGWPAAGVVLLSAEDGIADTIRPRLEAAGADLSRIVVFDDVDGGPEAGWRPPIIPDDLGTLADIVRSEQAGLVIIDPLFAFLSAANDSYRDQDIRRALHLVKLLAESTGAAVGVVRHPTKGSAGASSIYAGGGSIGVVGAARVGLFMGRDPEDETRSILAVAKSNLGPIPPSLELRLTEHPKLAVAQVEWVGESALSADQLNGVTRQTPRDEVAGEILRLLSGSPRMKQAEIIRALGRPEKDRTVRRALEGLVKEGDLDHESDGGTYGVPPATLARAGDTEQTTLLLGKPKWHLPPQGCHPPTVPPRTRRPRMPCHPRCTAPEPRRDAAAQTQRRPSSPQRLPPLGLPGRTGRPAALPPPRRPRRPPQVPTGRHRRPDRARHAIVTTAATRCIVRCTPRKQGARPGGRHFPLRRRRPPDKRRGYMPTKTAPVDPRDLILQAAEAITDASDCRGDDDDRLGLMYAIEREWDATDRRFVAARALIDHDRSLGGRYPLLSEAMGLLVQITDQTEDAILSLDDIMREDLVQTATELRTALDRLDGIVAAATAVPLLRA